MSKRDKIFKASKIIVSILGGWAGLMSGGLSIPFSVAAFHYQGHERRIFTFLAFVALIVFALRIVWKNYQLIEINQKLVEIGHNDASEAKARESLRQEAISLSMDKLIVRLNEMGEIYSGSYSEDVQKREEEKTSEDIRFVINALESFVGKDAAAMFRATSADPIPETQYDDHSVRRHRHRVHISYLQNLKTELKKIIEKQL